MKNRRHVGIFLGIFGVVILFLSFGSVAITGAVIGTNSQVNFTIFSLLGFILIAVSLIIEKQERKIKNKR